MAIQDCNGLRFDTRDVHGGNVPMYFVLCSFMGSILMGAPDKCFARKYLLVFPFIL